MSASIVEVMERFLVASLQGIDASDGPAVRTFLHPECRMANPVLHPDRGIVEPGEMPPDGALHGLTCLEDNIAVIQKYWKMSVRDVEVHDAGEFVVITGIVWVEGRKSGRATETRYMEIYRFRDDLIVEIQPCQDSLAFAQAL